MNPEELTKEEERALEALLGYTLVGGISWISYIIAHKLGYTKGKKDRRETLQRQLESIQLNYSQYLRKLATDRDEKRKIDKELGDEVQELKRLLKEHISSVTS